MACNVSCASLIFSIALLCALPFGAAQARDPKAVSEFKRENPCPATGERRGACPGYVVDHVTPLCAGGADAPINMQWQTVADGKIKDAEERKMCNRRNL